VFAARNAMIKLDARSLREFARGKFAGGARLLAAAK
jgi:hypothetical protein